MKRILAALLALSVALFGGVYATHKDAMLGFGNPTIVSGSTSVTTFTVTNGLNLSYIPSNRILFTDYATNVTSTAALTYTTSTDILNASTIVLSNTIRGSTNNSKDLGSAGTSWRSLYVSTTAFLVNLTSTGIVSVTGTLDFGGNAVQTCAGVNCKRTLFLSAAGCNIPNAGGATTSTLDYFGNNVVRDVYFQPLTYNACIAQWAPPNSWDGTLSAVFVWNATTVDANGVTWGLQAQGIGASGLLNTAFSGATGTVTMAATTTNAVSITSSTAITVGGSTVNPELVNLRVTRSNVGASTNTSALLGVILKYGSNKLTD
jgi:hypothetical protein